MNVNHYTLLKEEYIEEMNGTAYLLTHNKTKAKVMLVQNDDNNKVLRIIFHNKNFRFPWDIGCEEPYASQI